MRLTDDLAARRRLYARPAFTAPAMMLIDVPPHLAGADLPLGRYYPVILENDAELAEFEIFLAADRASAVVPDIFATRPSTLYTGAIALFEYAAPEAGWPWLLLCHWPREHTARAAHDPQLLARGAYTIEIFLGRADLRAAIAILSHQLGGAVSWSIVTGSDRPHGSS